MHIKKKDENVNMQGEPQQQQEQQQQVPSLLDFPQHIWEEAAFWISVVAAYWFLQNQVPPDATYMLYPLETYGQTAASDDDNEDESDESDYVYYTGNSLPPLSPNSYQILPGTTINHPKIIWTDDDDDDDDDDDYPPSFYICPNYFHFSGQYQRRNTSTARKSNGDIVLYLEPYQNDSNSELETETIVPMTPQEIEDIENNIRI